MSSKGSPTLEIAPQELFSLIEKLHDNVVISDSTGTILWVSASFEKTYEVRRDEVIGRKGLELEEARVFYPSVANLVLKSRQRVTITEENDSGRRMVTGIPVFDDNGAIELVVSFTVDPNYFLALNSEFERIQTALRSPHGSPKTRSIAWGIVGESRPMQQLRQLVEKVAPVETNLLVTGESGVGKNVIARVIHQASNRAEGPCVEINCAGIPAGLLESELFGYEAGAFTGANRAGKRGLIEMAGGGTLVLDEIGELPMELQAKLLHVIQERRVTKIGGTTPQAVDFRLIAVTNRDLRSLVRKGKFREDLFFRLNVVPVHVPSLRERPQDILPIAEHYLREYNAKYTTSKVLAPCVRDVLTAYSWPGNVRQLRNLIERLVIVSDDMVIRRDCLPDHILPEDCGDPADGRTLPQALEELERRMVLRAYRTHGTTVGAAKELGISQPTAARKVTKYVKEG